jgi:type VI protein secretion system component VasK
LAAQYFNPADHGALRENLRLYLLLTTDGKPHLEDIEGAALAASLLPPVSQEVQHKMGAENLPLNFEAALEPHLRLWSGRFVTGRRPALERTRQNVVQGIRAAILGNPSIEGLYASIVAAEDPNRDLTLQAMSVPADGILKSAAKVRGFYTKSAFDAGALQRLGEGAEQPHRKDWVLGDQVAAKLPPEMQDKQKLARALVDRYFEEYAAEWIRFLQSLSVRVPADPALAAGKLDGGQPKHRGDEQRPRLRAAGGYRGPHVQHRPTVARDAGRSAVGRLGRQLFAARRDAASPSPAEAV